MRFPAASTPAVWQPEVRPPLPNLQKRQGLSGDGGFAGEASGSVYP